VGLCLTPHELLKKFDQNFNIREAVRIARLLFFNDDKVFASLFSSRTRKKSGSYKTFLVSIARLENFYYNIPK